jgi:carbon storage regulator CsrA
MLMLSRRPNEKIVLPGLGVTVQVVSVKPGVVRLGIEAPAAVQVLREELLRRPAPDLAVTRGLPERG